MQGNCVEGQQNQLYTNLNSLIPALKLTFNCIVLSKSFVRLTHPFQCSISTLSTDYDLAHAIVVVFCFHLENLINSNKNSNPYSILIPIGQFSTAKDLVFSPEFFSYFEHQVTTPKLLIINKITRNKHKENNISNQIDRQIDLITATVNI